MNSIGKFMALITTTLLGTSVAAFPSISFPTFPTTIITGIGDDTLEKPSVDNFYATPIAPNANGYESYVNFKVYFPRTILLKAVDLYFESDDCAKKLLASYSVLRAENSNSGFYTYTEFNGYTNPKFILEASVAGEVTSFSVVPKVQQLKSYPIPNHAYIMNTLQVGTYNQSGDTFYLNDKVTFEGFEIAANPYYGYLDLNKLRVTCDYGGNSYAVVCGTILMTLSNIGDLYHEFGDYAGFDFTNIQLSLINGGDGWYHIQFKNDIYVNPLTREMSNTYKSGYVATRRYLYMPRNMKSTVDKINLYLSINGLGYSRNSYRQGYQLTSINYDMGYCSNSHYCVESSSSDNNNDLGKLITP